MVHQDIMAITFRQILAVVVVEPQVEVFLLMVMAVQMHQEQLVKEMRGVSVLALGILAVAVVQVVLV